jgi:hypothetical protein
MSHSRIGNSLHKLARRWGTLLDHNPASEFMKDGKAVKMPFSPAHSFLRVALVPSELAPSYSAKRPPPPSWWKRKQSVRWSLTMPTACMKA